MSSSWAKGLISLGSVTITVWLACFGLKTLNISSSNRDLCYCRSFQPTPSSAEILLLSLILSQAVSTSPWSSKFSKATKLSENLTWYSSVTCSPCCRVKLWFFFACHLHPLIGGGGMRIVIVALSGWAEKPTWSKPRSKITFHTRVRARDYVQNIHGSKVELNVTVISYWYRVTIYLWYSLVLGTP